MRTGVVICGELSQLPELNTLVEEYFNAPVRIAFDNTVREKTNILEAPQPKLIRDPLNTHLMDGYRIESISELVLAPEYATCLGLLAHAGLLNKTHIKIARSKISKLWNKAVGWLSEHF
jgi:cell division ATPase FtsA